MLQANWVDLSLLIFLLFFIWEGLRRGFLSELLDLAAFLAAFFFSLRFYNQASILIEQKFFAPHSLADILGFISIWFLMESVLFALIKLSLLRLILKHLKISSRMKRLLNSLAVIPAFLRGLAFVSLLLLIIGTFPIQPKLKIAVTDSKLGSYLLKRISSLEAPFKNIFGGVTEDTLTFLTIKPRSEESVNLGFNTADFVAKEPLEQEMVLLVNKERQAQNLKELKFDLQLQEVARFHSRDMFIRGYFSHHSPEDQTVADRAKSLDVDYLVIGENLAFAPTLDLAHKGLMNSESHRLNILSPEYHKIGIGIMESKEYGLMITQVFSN